MVSGVYVILNTVNGRRYVGSSVDIPQRWREHLSRLRREVHVNLALQADWLAHGPNAFHWQVSEWVDGPKALRIAAEQRHLDAAENCYNAAERAGSGPRDGFRHTPESIATMRRVAQGKRGKSPETRARIVASRRGQRLSPAHKEKIGLALRGKPRDAQSAAMKGKPWSLARRHAHDPNRVPHAEYISNKPNHHV